MSVFLLFVLAFAAGSLIPVQTSMNATLGRALGSPLLASLFVFAIALVVVAAMVLSTRMAPPSTASLQSVPLATWFGGVIGVFYIVALASLAPRLGVGVVTALVVAGQVVTGAVLEHFGLFGLPQVPFGIARAAAVSLIVGGIALLKFG